MRKTCENYIAASVEEVQGRIRELRKRGYLPKDRSPHPDEIEACTPFLDRQIKIIKPRFIVTLGRHSASYIFVRVGQPFKSMACAHGKVFRGTLFNEAVTIIPTYHPAASLHNPKYGDLIEGDFRVIGRELKRCGLPRVTTAFTGT